MTLPKYALRYHRQPVEQLQQFLRQQNFKDPLPDTQADCISSLGQLDANANIRFLDFAPEVCNVIYELLLNHNRSKGVRGHSTILRAFKQVHSEARNILYEDSDLTVRAEFIWSQMAKDVAWPDPAFAFTNEDMEWLLWHKLDMREKLVFEEGGYEPPPSPRANEEPLYDRCPPERCLFFMSANFHNLRVACGALPLMHMWPNSIRDISRIGIIIRLGVDPIYRDRDRHQRPNYYPAADHFLHSLVSSLNVGTKPQLLKLTLQDESEADNDELQNVFQSLAKLRPGVTLEFHCHHGHYYHMNFSLRFLDDIRPSADLRYQYDVLWDVWTRFPALKAFVEIGSHEEESNDKI